MSPGEEDKVRVEIFMAEIAQPCADLGQCTAV